MSALEASKPQPANSRTTIGTTQIFILAAWFGALTGIGEVFLLGIKKYLLHQFVLLGPQVLWMSPLADMMIFVLLVSPLAAVNWRKWGTISLQMILILLSSLTFLSFTLMYTPLHRGAALVLSLGLAIQTSWIIGKFKGAFLRLVNRSYTWMMAGLGLIAFGMVLLKP